MKNSCNEKTHTFRSSSAARKWNVLSLAERWEINPLGKLVGGRRTRTCDDHDVHSTWWARQSHSIRCASSSAKLRGKVWLGALCSLEHGAGWWAHINRLWRRAVNARSRRPRSRTDC